MEINKEINSNIENISKKSFTNRLKINRVMTENLKFNLLENLNLPLNYIFTHFYEILGFVISYIWRRI